MGLRGLISARWRARHAGPAHAAPDNGMVTLEAALATLSLSMVTAGLVCAFVVLGAQLRVNDAVRVAARAEAAGVPGAVALGLRSAPEATVNLSREGATIVASAAQTVRLPLAGLPAITVTARAEVVDEAAVLDLGL